MSLCRMANHLCLQEDSCSFGAPPSSTTARDGTVEILELRWTCGNDSKSHHHITHCCRSVRKNERAIHSTHIAFGLLDSNQAILTWCLQTLTVLVAFTNLPFDSKEAIDCQCGLLFASVGPNCLASMVLPLLVERSLLQYNWNGKRNGGAKCTCIDITA